MFLENNNYAVKYILNLINNGSINLQEPLQIIYKIINDEQVVIYEMLNKEKFGQSKLGQIEETLDEKKRLEWGKQDTNVLLEKYEIYMKMVGPMKMFKNKKVMWEKITQDIENNMGRKYTSIQVENRFKTLIKRKKDAIEHNKRSGNERVDIPYEEQLEKIASLDDSIKPEILMSINSTKILKSQNESNYSQPDTSSNTVKMASEKKTVKSSLKENIKKIKENEKKSIRETLRELHQLKEENKERRHKEKLQLIKELFKKDM